MARPKYGRGQQTARDRLIATFWDMIATTPYEKVSVRALVRESGVNKNTFYYHFDGVADLARQATDGALDPAFLSEMLAHLRGGPAPNPLSHPNFQERFERVRTIARAKGTPELQDMLKRAIAERWGEAAGFDADGLDPQRALALEFALGGVVAVLAHDGTEALPDPTVSRIPQAVAIILGILG